MKLHVLTLAAAFLLASPMQGEPGTIFQVDYSNPSLVPATWTLVLRADGSGHFHSARGAVVNPSDMRYIEPGNVDRDIRLSDDFTAHVFDVMHRQKRIDEGCESHLKVAFQGTKKFTFTTPQGAESCEFNYSKNHEIQSLGESMIAVASTILAGARLELLLQHDPLGLDQEMQYLSEGVKDGRLQQVCAIRGILQKLEDDPSVMERVRKRAGMLLAESN